MKNNSIRKSAFKQVKLDYLMDLFNVGRVSKIADLIYTILMPPNVRQVFLDQCKATLITTEKASKRRY